MTISGTPSRAISTAWAWRSWCGANPAPNSGHTGGATQLGARRGGGPVASTRLTVEDAEQRTDRQVAAHVKPRLGLFPAPGVHADLTATPTHAAADQQRATALVEIALA
jgi:hypothetical protein